MSKKIHLTRDDIKYSSNPIGDIVPEYVGQYCITNDNKVFFANGFTANDWIEASGNNDALDGVLQEIISNLEETNSNLEETNSNLEEVRSKSGDLNSLKTQDKTNLVEAINELFQSASDGKTKIATAITGKGVSASSSDTFDSLSTKIGQIKKAEGNAVAANVLSGKTFTNANGGLITGTMANRGGAQTVTPGTANKTLSAGYYSGNITIAGDADLVAANIVKGKNIFGVAGTLSSMKVVAKDCYYSLSSKGSITISDSIGFTPKIVFAHVYINHSYGYLKGWISSIGGDWDSAFGCDFDNYCYVRNISSTGFKVTIGNRETKSFYIDKWFAIDTDITFESYDTCCFDPGSQVLMADKSTKNIEDIIVGDIVLSLNEDTGEFIHQKVKGTIINPKSDDLVYVNLSNGEQLGMRAYHPLLTTEGWKSLRPELAETVMDVGIVPLLEIGDVLVGHRENASIVSIEARPHIKNYSTYNLDIEGYDNYIVNGIVAHNAACPTNEN